MLTVTLVVKLFPDIELATTKLFDMVGAVDEVDQQTPALDTGSLEENEFENVKVIDPGEITLVALDVGGTIVCIGFVPMVTDVRNQLESSHIFHPFCHTGKYPGSHSGSHLTLLSFTFASLNALTEYVAVFGALAKGFPLLEKSP